MYLRITVTADSGQQLSYKPLDPNAANTNDELTQTATTVANGLPWLWEVMDDTGAVINSRRSTDT